MTNSDLVRVSKRLALHLRHAPERIGIELEEGGWVGVDALLAALGRHGLPLTRAELAEVVERNDKRRFAFDDSGTRIRASQGHSVAVELDLPVSIPPAALFHGSRFLPAILREGLRPMRRHDVHLSATRSTAMTVGARRGEPVLLRVDAAAMAAEGHEFRVSANGVWLTRHVPPGYLTRLQ
ncbi:RNA 2'-phosphotransferase [Prauserella flavalba]|uniref:Probable RNA 2'-phosphotransferase n=1 Tax=Prauserella flavalba TaxID=1477506 RepID=A0A318LSJ2_9PSEU|nr:RNA 2'-phosphotransferase [Prauserella flavalba]PXY24603.1 RNA 2'-phosphotransferase [Prauserella flavalba]